MLIKLGPGNWINLSQIVAVQFQVKKDESWQLGDQWKLADLPENWESNPLRHEYRAIVETTNGETVHLSGKEMADLSDLLFLLSGAKPIPPEAPDPEPDTADAVDLADVLGDLNNALFK